MTSRPTRHGPCAGCQAATLTRRAVRKGRTVWLCASCDSLVAAMRAMAPEPRSGLPAHRAGMRKRGMGS
jgi:ribosomal protein L37AE/L43A